MRNTTAAAFVALILTLPRSPLLAQITQPDGVTIDITKVPPGLDTLEGDLWRNRVSHKAALEVAAQRRVRDEQRPVRRNGRPRENRASNKKGGDDATQPGSPAWRKRLDDALFTLYSHDPRRFCADDLAQAPAFTFMLRHNLTLVDALERGDVDEVAKCDQRWERWILTGACAVDGLASLPPVRQSRLHAPPFDLPDEIVNCVDESKDSAPGRSQRLEHWRLAPRDLTFAKDTQSKVDHLARLQAEVKEQETKLAVARSLGDERVIRAAEGALASSTRGLVDAGHAEPFGRIDANYRMLQANGRQPINAVSFSLQPVVFARYAPWSHVEWTLDGMKSHIAAILSGTAPSVKTAAPADVIAAWKPVLSLLDEIKSAITASDYATARRNVEKLRLFVLDPEQRPLE